MNISEKTKKTILEALGLKDLEKAITELQRIEKQISELKQRKQELLNQLQLDEEKRQILKALGISIPRARAGRNFQGKRVIVHEKNGDTKEFKSASGAVEYLGIPTPDYSFSAPRLLKRVAKQKGWKIKESEDTLEIWL